jgi:multiple sugar transport system substrate-binding protein
LGFDRDLALQYFGYWRDLQDAGALVPADVHVANDGNAAEDSLFAKRFSLAQVFPANQFEGVKKIIESAEMVPLPKGPTGAGDAFVVSGQSISANAEPDHARWAAHYIDYFLNDAEAAAIYLGDNGIPASAAGRKAIAHLGLRQLELFEKIRDSVPPFAPLPVGHGKVIDSLARACEAVAFDQLTIEQGVDRFMAEARSALQR